MALPVEWYQSIGAFEDNTGDCVPYKLWERLPPGPGRPPICPVRTLSGEYLPMPIFIPAGGSTVCQWIVQGHVDTQMVMNVWYFTVNNPTLGDAIITNYLNAQRGRWRAHILPTLSEEYVVDWYIARRMKQGVGIDGPFAFDQEERTLVDPELDHGELEGECMPALVAATAQLQGVYYGKTRRGSKRLPGIPENFTEQPNGNYLIEAPRVAMEDGVNAFIANSATVSDGMDFQLVVASNTAGQSRLPNNPLTWDTWINPLTGASVHKRVTSQVSRKPRRDFF